MGYEEDDPGCLAEDLGSIPDNSRPGIKGDAAAVARRKRNQTTENHGAQSTLPPAADERLDVPALETWLWDAACAIRGATDASKFKDFRDS